MRERWRVAVLDSGLRVVPVRLDRTAAGGSAAARGSAATFDPGVPLHRAAPLGAAASRVATAPGDLSTLPDPVAACRFIDDGHSVLCSALVPDSLGHGTSVAEVICSGRNTAWRCDLLIGQVLDHRGVTTAAALAAAIDWSVREGADLIHMSLGLREDRQILAEAVAAVVEAGCIIVASTPARGEATHPARYAGVIRATGDARCQWDEISDLHSGQADYGGCPRYALEPAASDHANAIRLGGASLGAAHVTRFLAENVAPGLDAAAVRTQLSAMARYTGVENRFQA